MDRKIAINKLLWSKKNEFWCDYNIKEDKLNDKFYISNFDPLWVGIEPPNANTDAFIVKTVNSLLMKYKGGVPVSFINSTQQWDFPNVWAPYHHSVVCFLLEYNKELALKIAKIFFNTVFLGWKNDRVIYEKYNALFPGKQGTGGEYLPQSGFGWTNGVTLHFINTFKDKLIS